MKNKKDQIEKIRAFLREDKIESALDCLNELFQDDEFFKEILFQKGRYASLVRDDRLSIASYSEIKIERNRIRKSIIDLVSEFERKNNIDYRKIGFKKFFLKNKNILLFSSLSLVFILIAIIVNIEEQKRLEIRRIDLEISERIKHVNILNWYKSSIEQETIINLPNKLFFPPEPPEILFEEYKNKNFNTLIIELRDLIRDEEQRRVLDTAIVIFDKMYSEYQDIKFDASQALNFYTDLVELNEYRWSKFNRINSNSIDSIGKELILISTDF